jgi:two-component system nitrate/nitrite response regulator NarL
VRRTRILVADPLRIFRSGVRNLLARESDFEVIEAGSFHDVLEVIADDCPDIALIDLELPPFGGITAVQRLSRK